MIDENTPENKVESDKMRSLNWLLNIVTIMNFNQLSNNSSIINMKQFHEQLCDI